MAETRPYDFDVQAKPATMLIQIMPAKYVRINGRTYHPMRQTVMKPNGEAVKEWEFKTNAQVWVPPEIGNQLIKTAPTEKTGPMATLLKTRSQEEAMPTVKVKKPEAGTDDGTNKAVTKTRRKPKEDGTLESLSYNQLQKLAAEKGIKSFGVKKAELLVALKEADNGGTETTEA